MTSRFDSPSREFPAMTTGRDDMSQERRNPVRVLDGIRWERNQRTESWKSPLGTLVQSGREWHARPDGEKEIGPFKTMLQAHVAISRGAR